MSDENFQSHIEKQQAMLGQNEEKKGEQDGMDATDRELIVELFEQLKAIEKQQLDLSKIVGEQLQSILCASGGPGISRLPKNAEVGKASLDYINAMRKLIPEYDGSPSSTSNLQSFIRNSDELVNVSDVPEELTITYLIGRLTKFAAHWFREYTKENPLVRKSYSNFREALLKQFLSEETKQRNMQCFLSCKQGRKSIQDFVDEFLEAGALVADMSDKMRLGLFIAAVNKSYQERINNNPVYRESLNNAIEGVLSATDLHSNEKAYFANNRNLSGSKNLQRVRVCYNCFKKGHIAEQCRSKPKSRFKGYAGKQVKFEPRQKVSQKEESEEINFVGEEKVSKD
jgi:Ty3 transposon capsid-like protein